MSDPRKVCAPNIIHVIKLMIQTPREACTASPLIQLLVDALRAHHHLLPPYYLIFANHHRLNLPLFPNGESPIIPFNSPPPPPIPLPLITLPTPSVPVQNTQTKTFGSHSSLNPTQPRCNHLLQASHCTIGLPSSIPSQTQRVLSFDRVLHSVDGVVVVDGEWLKELV